MRTVELKIEDVAFGGKAVARDNGKAVFVPFAIDGEKVSAQIVREKKQFAEAEVLEIREASPCRVTPTCPYFGRCGGCAYQHIDYQHQLEIKWRQVRDVLRRIGKIENPPIRPIIPSPASYGYRNRITVHAQGGVVGFYRRESNRLVDIEQCPIASDEVNAELRHLREQAPFEGHYTLRAAGGPRIFAQTNDAVAETLRQLVINMVPEHQELLIDAYCGAGVFGKALSDKFDRVIGIDWDRFAIEEARKTATPKETYIAGDVDDELKKLAAVHRPSPEGYGDAGRTVTLSQTNTPDGQKGLKVWPLGSTAATCVILDPPATGLTNVARGAIVDLAPGTVIYISCNPATLARDLKDFQENFILESVTPLDMFPQTAEIEVAVHLCAKQSVAAP